ncbi:hypothetical protein [Bradyrhizobium erythrophlei]|jgi:hypothetical protein|uniref:Uncharacterized protein n=1 Tax=Bradyrhizobium erythrophlei TaxID=1437360 RepID=A0A1M7UL60_9BRAD|nr:hypothetical protein [Bradyrhizobium erythrophlei]SHN83762.1 hypothetical protein SAMN05444170_5623 [Bradyrhizobium erythrophlei]
MTTSKLNRVPGALFQALSKTVSSALSRINSFEKIEFSDRFYLVIPRIELTLNFMTVDEVSSTKLSVDEATELFKSIKTACEQNGIAEFKMGELSWKTDASSEGQVKIRYKTPQGSAYTIVERASVDAAIANFTQRFGLS